MDGNRKAKILALPMSPITRLSMAMDEELKRDKSGLLASLKDKYTERLGVAEEKRDKIFRSLFYVDAALAFLISGQNFKVPVLEISAIEIPAVVEAVTIASAVTIVFAVVQFITWASYDAIVRGYGNEAARPQSTDPEFINAAESHVELALKVLRTKFNIIGPDFYEPGRAFKVYSFVVFGLIQMLFVLFPIVHAILVYLSLKATYALHGIGLVSGVYYLIVI